MNIDGSLTEVGRLRLEVTDLKRRLGQREAVLEMFRESIKRADERANNYRLLAEARLDYVNFLNSRITALRGRICDLSDSLASTTGG